MNRLTLIALWVGCTTLSVLGIIGALSGVAVLWLFLKWLFT